MTIQQIVSAIRNAVYGREVREAIAQGIEKCYDDVSVIEGIMNFVDYSDIKTFTATPAYVEIGQQSANVTLNWTYNSTPTSLSINGYPQTQEVISARSFSANPYEDGTHEASYTLATNLGSKTIKFNFLNKVYYGAATVPGTLDGSFVKGLASSEYSKTKARTITVNATSGKYIWYAVPKRFGGCSFKVGGFDGGFQAAETVSVTNGSNYTEDYYVYHSTNASLGSTTVVVS